MRKVTLLVHLLVFATATLLMLPTAFAQSSSEAGSADGAARAAEFYEEAAQAYQAGEYARAAELLERAFAHEQNLVYKYNEVLAYLGLGDYERALRVLDIYGDPLRADGRFSDVDEIEEELNEGLAARQAREEAARAEAERQKQEQIAPPPAVDESANLLAWSLIGGGGAALIGGMIFSSGLLIGGTIDRLENSRTIAGYNQHYGEHSSFDRDEDLRQLRSHQIISAVLLGTGVLVSATGGALLYFDQSGGDRDPGHDASLSLEPALGAGFVGASLFGRF